MAFCGRPVSAAIEASAPKRAVGWHRFQRLRNDLFNLPVGDLARRADPRLIQQASPNFLNRSRHFPTIAPVIRNFRTTSELPIPAHN
jgi:hypothetical protein